MVGGVGSKRAGRRGVWLGRLALCLVVAILTLSPIAAGPVWALDGYTFTTIMSFGNGSAPQGLATDANGDVYVSVFNNDAVDECTAPCTSSSTPTTIHSIQAANLAVNSSNDVYLIDGSGNLDECAAPCTTSQSLTTIVSGAATYGLAVDRNNNVYYTTYTTIVECAAPCNSSSSTQTTIVNDPFQPNAVAVDRSGDVYIGDVNNSSFPWVGYLKECAAPCSTTTTVTTLATINRANPQGVAVDGNGNVYLADQGNQNVDVCAAPCTSSSTLTAIASSVNDWSVAVDPSNNVYFAEYGGTVQEAGAPPTPTATMTSTATATNTATNTPTPTDTATNTPTSTSTATATNTATNTATPTDTATNTPTSTSTPTPTDSSTATPTNTPTDTATSTSTDTPTATNTSTDTPTATATSTSTSTATSTLTPTSTAIIGGPIEVSTVVAGEPVVVSLPASATTPSANTVADIVVSAPTASPAITPASQFHWAFAVSVDAFNSQGTPVHQLGQDLTIQIRFTPRPRQNPLLAVIYTIDPQGNSQPLVTRVTNNGDGTYTATAQVDHLSPFVVFEPTTGQAVQQYVFPLVTDDASSPTGW